MADEANPGWRLDAVALALLAAGAAVAASLAAPGSLGVAGESAASAARDALGAGAGPLLLGWFALVGRYVARSAVPQIARRALGWGLLVVAVAAGADLYRAQVAPLANRYGPGGAAGAWITLNLADRTTSATSAVAVALAGLLGAALALDRLGRRVVATLASAVVGIGRALGGANRLVAAGNNLWLGALQRAATARPPEPAPTPPVEEVPLTPVKPSRIRAPKPEAVAEVAPAPEPPTEAPPSSASAPVPITRSAALSDTPPPLRPLTVPASEATGYRLPALDLLKDPDPFQHEDHEQRLRDRAALLEKTFADFDVRVKVVGIHTGPVITQYEISLETGLRLNKVTTLSDDLALNLGVQSVRIVAPLPGRTTVGVEVPNDHRQTVRLKELILATAAKAAKFKLPIFLGKDVEGRPLVYDMAAMPHLLIAGRTGTGKSVCLNTIILSFLFSRTPEECRLLLIDPKKVEFSEYGQIPHLMHPVVTDDKKAEAILAWAVDKMEERYELLRRARVRNVASYNELGWDELLKRVDPPSEEERQQLPRKLPYIVMIVDEVGDLLMGATKKEVESHIIRLAQKSRAAGLHLILATQKPTVDVITGLIKSNLPARVCCQVASRADSMVVLDEKGAEKLLGMGDMLFLQPGVGTIIRGQGTYVDDREIEKVIAELSQYEPTFEHELLNLKTRAEGGAGGGADGDFGEQLRARDPLYEQAIEIVIREQRGSTSLLQRALGVGYGRASRLVDFMAEDGIVGTFNGSNARDVLLSAEEWEGRKAGA